MIVIDGSEGEGGGQIVRNACALSLVTGESFRVSNIRGKRPKPGLMRQHLTAIEAACAISGSTCEGLSIGASEISFRPGKAVGGEYRFAVGTAGSTGLVLQTVLIPLALADEPSRVILEGGTHNLMAPPFEFIARSFLPVINRMGPRIEAKLVRHGFYPAGGGRIEVTIHPSPLRPIVCRERGTLRLRSATAVFAGLPHDIAARELATARAVLGWSEDAFAFQQIPEDRGPGNIILIEAEFDHVTEIVSGFGQLGVTAERVAKTAASRMNGYLESSAFAGPYLADQLLMPFAIARGSEFTTVKPSQHSQTAADVIALFLGQRPVIAAKDDGTHEVILR